jgi:hypothetical protein
MRNTLKRIHVTNHARINAHYYFEELYTQKYVDGMPIADHIAAILDLKSQIQDAGETLNDIHVAHAMVLSLPKTQSWGIIKIQLFNVESAKLTIDAVRGHLSVSLLPLSSPTLPWFICIPPPHLCTSSKDHTSSR